MKNKKCEWRDGAFTPCCNWIILDGDGQFTIQIGNRIWRGNPDYCPHCGADIRKPVEIKVGMIRQFWDDGESNEIAGDMWARLGKIGKGDFPYITPWGAPFRNFTPGLPEGFNQDGTPNRESSR